MVTKTDIELKNFFVFNATFGPKEGQVTSQIINYLVFNLCFILGIEKDTVLLSIH